MWAKREEDEQKVPLSHPLFTVTCLPATVEDRRRVIVRGLATPACTCARLSAAHSFSSSWTLDQEPTRRWILPITNPNFQLPPPQGRV